MRVLLTMLRRDLLARLRDRSAIAIGLLVPLVLIVVLKLTMGGPTVEQVPIGVAASSDGTPARAALVSGALPRLEDDGLIVVKRFETKAAARRAVLDDRVDAAIVVAGDPARFTVLRDEGELIGSGIAEGITRSVAAQVDAVTLAVGASIVLDPASADDAAGIAIDAARRLASVDPAITVRESTAKGLDTNTEIAAGMAVFFLFFAVQFGLLGITEERRYGTLRRILTAPVGGTQVLGAKVATSFLLGTASLTTLVVVSQLLLDADFGAPLGVAVLILSGVLAATATITLVVGITRTSEQAALAQSVIAMVLGILGGSFFSMARSGALAQALSHLTPHYWFKEGLVRMTLAGDWHAALAPAGWMLLFAAVLGIPGMVLARRTVRA